MFHGLNLSGPDSHILNRFIILGWSKVSGPFIEPLTCNSEIMLKWPAWKPCDGHHHWSFVVTSALEQRMFI